MQPFLTAFIIYWGLILYSYQYLKEDGRLDIERISKLPLEEKLRVIGRFTREQVDEYFSKVPVCHGPVKLRWRGLTN